MSRARQARAWLQHQVRWRDVILVALIGVSMLFTVHYVNAANHKFCQVINGFTSVPVARPVNPSANPSRVQAYEWYERFLALGRSLGC